MDIEPNFVFPPSFWVSTVVASMLAFFLLLRLLLRNFSCAFLHRVASYVGISDMSRGGLKSPLKNEIGAHVGFREPGFVI